MLIPIEVTYGVKLVSGVLYRDSTILYFKYSDRKPMFPEVGLSGTFYHWETEFDRFSMFWDVLYHWGS